MVMVGVHALTIPHNTPILSLQRLSMGRSEAFLRLSRKLIHAHLINRTYP
jgi:hypothetical protein